MWYFWILFTAFIWSLMNIWNKTVISKYNFNPSFALGLRETFWLLFWIMIFFLFWDGILNYYSYFIGLVSWLTLLYMFKSFKYINVWLAWLIMNSWFSFWILFSWLLLNINITSYQIILIFLIILTIGTYWFFQRKIIIKW